MSEWKEYKLGEHVLINHRSIDKNYPYKEIEYLDTGSITRGRIDSLQHLTLADAPSRAKRIVKDNDIVLSMVRPIQRHYGYLRKTEPNTVVSTGFVVLTNKESIDSYFLYSFLTQDEITEYLDAIAEGSTSAYPAFTPDVLEDLSILLPPLPEQRAIAGVLSSLDDKIDLLHRQNKTLEGIAEALWRKMFVEEADSGWKKGKLGDYITVKGGTTPSTNKPIFWNGNICWTSPRDLSGSDNIFLHETERSITQEGLAQIGSGLLPIGTVLLSSRAPIGYLAISIIPVAINQGYIAIICDRLLSNYYMFLWIKFNMDLIIGSANGSTFLEISKSVFKELEIEVPNESEVEKFDSIVKPVFNKILTNEIQTRTLSRLRDTLLPELMSGEVRVRI